MSFVFCEMAKRGLPFKQILIPFILSIVTLTVYLLAGLYPEGRIWGFNHWGYFGGLFPLYAFVAAFVSILIISFVFPNNIDDTIEVDSNKRTFLVFATLFSVIATICFWIFSTETHFLGDGYHVLAKLAAPETQVKSTEIGETWLHIALMTLIGEGTEESARLVYRILSVLAGFIFLISLSVFSKYYFKKQSKGIFFTLGVATGGFSLLFFGYVEHYSWMILFSTVTMLTGILSAKGKLNKSVPTALFLITVFMHVVAIAFIPAIIFLLCRNSFVSRLSSKIKISLVIMGIIICGTAILYLYNTNYFFRYAFVPLVPIEITAEGYTLFSFSHLLDYLNLLFLLFPGILILIWILIKSGIKKILNQPEYLFLILALISVGGFLFVLDPKLGMPRDWDLFSVVGVPFAAFHFLLLLDNRFVRSSARMIAIYSIILGLVALGSRVLTLNSPTVSIAHLMNTMNLDVAKNRAASYLLKDYYLDHADTTAADIETARWQKAYHEEQLAEHSKKYFVTEQFDQVIELNEAAIKLNPMYWPAYSNIGGALLKKGLNDSALAILKIADGINPNNPITLSKLGYAYFALGFEDKAEKILRIALELDSTRTNALIYLAYMYSQQGQMDKYVETLIRLEKRKDTPLDATLALMEYYLTYHQFEKAAIQFRKALKSGLDQGYVEMIFQKFPKFKSYIQ